MPSRTNCGAFCVEEHARGRAEVVRRSVFGCLVGFEVAAEGEVEVEAVLDALVAEADESAAGIDGAALGFEDFEDAGAGDSEAEVAFGLFLGEGGLFDFLEEEALLLSEGAVGLEGGFDFAEGGQNGLDVVADGGAVAREGGPCFGAGGAAAVDGLAEGSGDRPCDESGVNGAMEEFGACIAGAGEADRREEILAGGVGGAGGGEDAGPSGGEVGPAGEEAGGQSNGDLRFEGGEIGGCLQFAGRVAAQKELEGAGGFVALEDAASEVAFGGGDVVAAELDVHGAQDGGAVLALDEAEAGLEVLEGLPGEGELLLGFDEVGPCLGGIDGEREAGGAEVRESSLVVGVGGRLEVAEAAPEVDFPRRVERETVGLGGDTRSGTEAGIRLGGARPRRDRGEARGASDDRAFPGGAEAMGGCLQIVVAADRLPDEGRHLWVVEVGEPAGRNFCVAPPLSLVKGPRRIDEGLVPGAVDCEGGAAGQEEERNGRDDRRAKTPADDTLILRGKSRCPHAARMGLQIPRSNQISIARRQSFPGGRSRGTHGWRRRPCFRILPGRFARAETDPLPSFEKWGADRGTG